MILLMLYWGKYMGCGTIGEAFTYDCIRFQSVWPDWAIYWTLGNFLKPLAAINLPKSPTFLRKFL